MKFSKLLKLSLHPINWKTLTGEHALGIFVIASPVKSVLLSVNVCNFGDSKMPLNAHREN
jgi:hypothetical protein